MPKPFDLTLAAHMIQANLSHQGLKTTVVTSAEKTTIGVQTKTKVQLGSIEIQIVNEVLTITSMTGIFSLAEFEPVIQTIRESLSSMNDANNGK